MRHPIIAAVAHDDEARDAIALAADIARAEEAPLILAGVYVDALGPGAKGYVDAVRPALEDELNAAAATVGEGVTHEIRAVGSTSIVRGLHELAEHEDAAMLVLGPSHVGRVARAFAGDIAAGALHAAPCPVAVAPPGYAGKKAHAVRTVGVGYADTTEARDALEAAVDYARRHDARLRIIHVLTDPYAAMPYYNVEGPASDLQALRDDAEASLAAARSMVEDRVPVDTSLVNGDAVSRLADESGQLDVLFVGSRGFGPLRRVLLGSVAAGLVHKASCPVIVLPRGAHVHAETAVEA